MRILQVIPSLGRGGAERLVLNLSNELIHLGHQVLIVQLRPDAAYPELQGQVDIRLVSSKVYYSFLGNDSIETEEFNRVVDEFRPQVIHSHLLDSEFVSRSRLVENTLYVTHWHGCPNLTQPIPFFKWFTKESIWKWNTKRILKSKYKKSNTHFICISEFIGHYVQDRLDIGIKNVTVVPNAIDLTLFRPLDLAKKEGFRLINIGSLHQNKNQQFLLSVMKTLLDDGFTDVFLDIFGEGPEMANLQKKIESMGLSDNVVLRGVVSNPQEQMNRAHILVHSAWREPFGLVFIEAMACGIPAISFDTGGPSELIDHNENGYLVKNDDLDEFTNSIKILYQDRAKLTKMSKNALVHSQVFDLKGYAKKVEAVYYKQLPLISN